MTDESSPPAHHGTEGLRKAIDDRSAIIAVIGLGYVGLPTAVAYVQAGFTVVGVDSDPGQVDAVVQAHSHIEGVTSSELKSAVESGRLRAVGSVAEVGDFDVADICVHTPLDATHEPDLSAITSVGETLVKSLRPGQLVILTSTSYPGTTSEVLAPILAESGLRIGDEILLAFAPERIDPGNSRYALRNTPKVVGGVTRESTELATRVLQTIVDTIVPVSDAMVAEMVKILENTFRMVNIGFSNEMAMICRRLGINVWEVIDAASTKPFGFMPFYPGPGIGGHCIPIDPSYLAWKMRNLNFKTRFLDLGNEINRGMPDYVVRRCADVLNDKARSIRGSRILVVGAAYKPGVSDIRGAPTIEIMDRLAALGADIGYSDPHVAQLKTSNGLSFRSVPLDTATVTGTDLVVVATYHKTVDWSLLAEHGSLILDARGVHELRGLSTVHIL